MILTLLSLSSPLDLYLRIRMLHTMDSTRARRMYRDSARFLPDSLKVILSQDIGLNHDSLTTALVRSGSTDPYVWKKFLFLTFVKHVGDERGFEREVNRYLSRIDTSAEIVGFLGEIYENYGDLEKALRMYRLSLSLRQNSRILRNTAILFARFGMCDSALAYFGRIDKREIESTDKYERRRFYVALGMCYDRMGKEEEALKYYQEAYLLQKDTIIGFRIADILARKRGEEALSFLAALYEDVSFKRPNLHWGYALIMSSDTLRMNEGIREISHYLALHGDDARARNLLMHAFLRRGDTAIALKHAGRAYELDGKDDDYRLTYAYLLSYTTDNPRKFGYLLRERDKEDPLGMWTFARFYRMQGDHGRALFYYKRLVNMDPTNVKLNTEVYWYARKHGKLNLALRIMKNLKDRYPDSLNFWFELADVYVLMGMPDSVHAMYSHLVKHHGFKLKDCEMAAVLNNWAYTLSLAQYRLDTAKVLVDRAYDLCKLDHILDTKGWVYFLLGKHRKAEDLIERAIEVIPEDDINLPEVYLHLIIIRCHSGEEVDSRILREIDELVDPAKLRFYRRFLRECHRRD